MKIYCLPIFILCIAFSINAQDLSTTHLQSLKDEELLSLFNKVKNDSIKAEKVARVYLERAKKEKDTIKMARGYEKLARIYNLEKNIQFADSIIYISKNIDNTTYPALGYILKGYEYNRNGNLKKSLKNFILANEIAIKTGNISHQIYITDFLVNLRSFWGDKQKALFLQIKRHDIINNEDFSKKLKATLRKGQEAEYINLYKEHELSSILNFVTCYTNLKQLDSATVFLELGIKKYNEYNVEGNLKRNYNNFIQLSSIEIDFYNKKYYKSLKSIEKLSNEFESNHEKTDLRNLYFFKGLNFIKINNEEEGVKFLLKADSISELNTRTLVPYHRAIYENLYEFYNKNGDIDNKLIYLNKLLKADSIIKSNYLFFEASFKDDFETPKLINEKDNIITNLTAENKKFSVTIWYIFLALFICLGGFFYYYKRQQVYKKRFKLLIETNGDNRLKEVGERAENEISEEIIDKILKHLQIFETKNDFLFQDITLHTLAKTFGTNYKYLSNVINLYKEKRFSSYINDLRVVYIYNELKINIKFRKYSIKAIAMECGFNSAESFSKAFYKKFDIYPSFYIKQLDKYNATNN